MDYQADSPIYLQIMRELKIRMASGALQKGARLPSVREYALEFAVNPNTMQKALSELEREGLVYSERTAGRFVTEDQAVLEQARREMAEAYLKSFLTNMKAIGFAVPEIPEVLQAYISQEEDRQ